MNAQVFISYAREDSVEADRLAARLAAEGFSVYLDRNRVRSGDFAAQLETAISRCDVFLLLLSRASARSRYVRRELHVAADEYERPVLPVLLEEADLAPFRLVLGGLQLIDYRDRSESQVADVIDGVYREQTRARRERRDPGKGLRVAGTIVAAIGVAILVGALGFFALNLINVAGTDLEDPTPSFEPFAVSLGVFFVGMVVAGVGEALRRAGRRR